MLISKVATWITLTAGVIVSAFAQTTVGQTLSPSQVASPIKSGRYRLQSRAWDLQTIFKTFTAENARADSGNYLSISERTHNTEITLERRNIDLWVAIRYRLRAGSNDDISQIQQWQSTTGAPLGEQVINGHKVIGIVADLPQPAEPQGPKRKFRIWKNASNAALELVEDVECKATYDNFEFNLHFPDKWFSLTVPSGVYWVEALAPEQRDLRPPPGPDLLKRLTISDNRLGRIGTGSRRKDVEALLGKPEFEVRTPTGLIMHEDGKLHAEIDARLEYPSMGIAIRYDEISGAVSTVECNDPTYVGHVGRPFPGKTDKGLHIGSTIRDIKAAYGEQINYDEIGTTLMCGRIWFTCTQSGDEGRIWLIQVN